MINVRITMQRTLLLWTIVSLCTTTFLFAQEPDRPVVLYPVFHDTSPPLAEMIANAPPVEKYEGPAREIPNHMFPPVEPLNQGAMDPVVQNLVGTLASPNVLANFEGIGNLCGCYPPDPNGAPGLSHYVQTLNTHFAIWDKQGTQVQAPQLLQVLWSGTAWSTRSDGDPVVLYDRYADRWIIMQFYVPDPPNLILFAVSATSNPLGSYHRYGFTFTAFPDYPKISVWRDAYYLGVASFNPNYIGDGVAAVERDSMLVGGNARIVFFQRPTSDPRFLPADVDGQLPAVGSPNYFTGLDIPNQRLRIYEFAVNWQNTASSTFTNVANLTVASFSQLCSLTRNCIPQPGTNVRLDALSDRLMFRVQFRNFGSYQTLVANHTVGVGTNPNRAGVRWYEMRRNSGTWSLYQQGTYAPDTVSRWMGSVAMDKFGNIGLGYSVSSGSVYPSIRFTGRRPTDALGLMTLPETTIVAGGGSQTGNANRWGDYSSLNLDPSDDWTMWYTNEYIQTTGATPWKTRIAAFRFPSADTSITVTAPNGGEQWLVGSTHAIQWSSINVSGNVKIELSTNGGVTFPTVLFASTADDGTENWTVSGPTSTQARIRISSLSSPSVADTSDANFAIVPPSITVTAPNGGESWGIGSLQNIAWTSNGVSGNVKIELSTNGGSTFPTVLFASIANSGTQSWTVAGPANGTCRIRVSSVADPTIRDSSDANFTIVQPTVTVTVPNGGESWGIGTSQSIQWSSSNLTGNVTIELSRNGGTTFSDVLFANTVNDGTESWTVTGPATTQARIRVSSVNDPTIADTSNANFVIIQPTVTVSAPDGGEVWYIGSSESIQWSSANLGGNVKIELSRNGGATFSEVLFASTANDGNEAWTVTGPITGLARIKVSSVSDPTIADTSNANFSIAQPGITVTAPNGGETWTIGTSQTIQWTSVGVSGAVKIELSTNGGATFPTTLVAGTANDGAEDWVVSGPVTTQARIRVSSVDSPTVQDVSDANFSVVQLSGVFRFLNMLVVRDNGGLRDTLTFGTGEGATDGIDPLFNEEELPPLPPPGTFDARWQIAGTQGSRWDVRDTLGGNRTQITYTGHLQAGEGGFPFTLRWNPAQLPPGLFVLRDVINGNFFRVNMRSRDSLVITNPSLASFRIVYAAQESFREDFAAGWNVFSLPMTVADRSTIALFPNVISNAYAYANGSYIFRDTLRYGEGYWMKFPSADSITYTGTVRDLDTVDVNPGWNLIGTISYPVSTSGIVQIPAGIVTTPFYGYTPGIGYDPVTTLLPGGAYWVKVSQSGKLGLVGSTQSQSVQKGGK
jgi:hypothetical protein